MNRDLFFNAGLHFEPSNQFESAVSSIVSSPVSNDIVAIQLLNSSPPGPNLPILDHLVKENLPRIRNSMAMDPNLRLLEADPGFAERAAKFSCFGSRSVNERSNEFELNSNKKEARFESSGSPASVTGKFARVSSSPAMKSSRLSGSGANSAEESSVSEQVSSGEFGFKNRKDSSSRKRKGVIGLTRRKEEAIDDSKRRKKTEDENGDGTTENMKPPEPPKDYIHVRARRGQATDSHSLAERVRRKKISQRMKLLQSLVPNCDKVTGKTLMLDEIINYVQSLQREVEFLSMKLATVNPSLDFATNDIISQNINQLNGNLSQQTSLYQQNHQELFNQSALMTQSVHEFSEPFRDYRGFGEDDLQNIIRMGFDQNLNLDTSFFQTMVDQPSNMKTEL